MCHIKILFRTVAKDYRGHLGGEGRRDGKSNRKIEQLEEEDFEKKKGKQDEEIEG